MKHFRHILPETINAIIAARKKTHPGLHKLGTDLAVPDERLADMWAVYRDALADAGLEWAAFGHIGNNHVHINIMPRDMADLQKALGLYQMFAEKAVAFGGYGLGRARHRQAQGQVPEDDVHARRRSSRCARSSARSIRGCLLNPGNIFEDSSPAPPARGGE